MPHDQPPPSQPAGPPGESLARSTTTSVFWMTAQKWVSRVGGLATIILLTRLLSPEDFGLAATASTLMPFVYLLADVGFSTYIVQASSIDSRTLSTAFWFSLLVGGTLSAFIIFAGAQLLGTALSLPAAVPLIQAVTASVMLVAASSVPMALLRRSMKFRKLAIVEVTGAVVAQGAAITAAFLGVGAWALILQLTVAQLITAVWVWFAARWHPTREFSRSQFRTMGAFGVQAMGGGLVTVARYWAETVIVVAGLGVREMGYINIAQRLVNAAQDLSAAALLPVTTVAFSRVRENAARLRSFYSRASSLAHAVVAPLMIYLAVAAPVLVPFLFGEGKEYSVLVTPAMAAVALLNVSWTMDEGLHLGVGRPGRWFAWLLVGNAVALVLLAVSVRWGLAALITAWVAGSVLQVVGRWFVVAPLIGDRVTHVAFPLLGVVGPSMIAAAAGYGCFRLISRAPDVVVLAATGLVVVGVYLAALRLLRPRLLGETLSLVPARFSRHVRWFAPRGGADDARPL